VLLAAVPVEQAAANNRLPSKIKPKTFLGFFMMDAPAGLFRKFSIFSALFKVGRPFELTETYDKEFLFDPA